MENRLRWMQGATALLYLGPLLAGLGGFGWSVVPVFAAIFLLWLFILRPQQWPRKLTGWQQPQALVTLAAQAATQVLLVLVCFGIGRGIGGVLGAVPALPLMLPVAISFLSIPMCRMLWDPWKIGRIDSLGSPATATEPATAVAKAEVMLAALPQNLSAEDTIDHLRAMEATVSPVAIRDALLAMADRGETSHLRTLAIFAVDCRLVGVVEHGLPSAAFHRLPDDPALITIFAERGWACLKTDSDLFWDFPRREILSHSQSRLQGTEAALALGELLALYDEIEADQPDDGAKV